MGIFKQGTIYTWDNLSLGKLIALEGALKEASKTTLREELLNMVKSAVKESQ